MTKYCFCLFAIIGRKVFKRISISELNVYVSAQVTGQAIYRILQVVLLRWISKSISLAVVGFLRMMPSSIWLRAAKPGWVHFTLLKPAFGGLAKRNSTGQVILSLEIFLIFCLAMRLE